MEFDILHENDKDGWMEVLYIIEWKTFFACDGVMIWVQNVCHCLPQLEFSCLQIGHSAFPSVHRGSSTIHISGQISLFWFLVLPRLEALCWRFDS